MMLDIHIYKCETLPYLFSSTEIRSKWITDVNVRGKPLKLLEENVRERDLILGYAKMP